MTRHTFLVAGTTLLAAALFAPTGASASKANSVSATQTNQTLDKKRRCKAGYRYSHSRMKCVKRKYRGSH